MMEDGQMESERYVVRDEKMGVKRGRYGDMETKRCSDRREDWRQGEMRRDGDMEIERYVENQRERGRDKER